MVLNKYEYTLNEIPKSLNHYLTRPNTHEYRQAKKRFARDIFYIVNANKNNKPKKPINKAIVIYTYNFKDMKRRDPDNYNGKMLNDALVNANVLEDDTFENVTLLFFATFGNAKESTTINILEVDDLPKDFKFLRS